MGSALRAHKPYLLYAETREQLGQQTSLHTECIEPLLVRLESAITAGSPAGSLREIRDYLHVCRWGFRKVEYSFALDALLAHLRPGDVHLDAGCGVTPLAHVVAERGIQARGCDGDRTVIETLKRLHPSELYGSSVEYAAEGLTAMSYPDEAFDAVSCISVLEHIPAPYDQTAVRELLRVLKPGGLLVLTVDFTPREVSGSMGRWRHYWTRTSDLARRGQVREIARGFTRKLRAQDAVRQGLANWARSANQCFEVRHLEADIFPLLAGDWLESALPFVGDFRTVTPSQARMFWQLETDASNGAQPQAKLPVGCIVRKPRTGA